jgi:hypothetical protein
MKKLGKLQINPEKLMNNLELITLKGGYGGACCWCYSNSQGGGYHMLGATGPEDCTSLCKEVGYDGGRWDC